MGYNVYANRIYLADVRTARFTQEEIQIASHLGIGLIQIQNRVCTEVLSSPFYNPIRRLNLALLEKLRLGRCQLCESFFETGIVGQRYANVTNENVRQAIKKEKGMIFRNPEVAERKHKLGLRVAPNAIYERRFVCPDCVHSLFSQLCLSPKQQ